MAPKCATNGYVLNACDIGKKTTGRQAKCITEKYASPQGYAGNFAIPSQADAAGVLRKRTNQRKRSYEPSAFPTRKPVALTVAGSDSGGCAGAQADLETFAAFGLHGACAITAVTAQNSRRVVSIHRVPARELAAQLAAVFADLPIAAVKVGMLASRAAVATLASALRAQRAPNVVVDPVLASSSGTPLLPPSALARLRNDLLPLASLLTPNVPEAEILLGRRLRGGADLVPAARELLRFGPRAVLLKGGHLRGNPVRDVLIDAASGSIRWFEHARLPLSARGTGCTLAAAIAAGMALGLDLNAAVERGERYLQACLQRAYPAGRGRHFALEHLSKSNSC
jgi:hydroxymethylpyrimidine/phosphomethylpyrimidine kinase